MFDFKIVETESQKAICSGSDDFRGDSVVFFCGVDFFDPLLDLLRPLILIVVLLRFFWHKKRSELIFHFLGIENNSSMNLSKGKSATPKPPEKGSFPLDHDSECGTLMRRYMQCLKENDFVSRYCRSYSKEYLQCRMNKYV